MPLAVTKLRVPASHTITDPWERVEEAGMFFEERSREFRALRRLIVLLRKARIPYAVVGGMAVNLHKYRRTTDDVDMLLSQKGFDEFCRRFVPRSYDAVPGRPYRFWDRRYRLFLDFLVTGNFPGSGDPGPVSYPDPMDVRQIMKRIYVVNLPTLITLKLAARRLKDFADVIDLIRRNELDDDFASQVHPSVRRDYIECLEEMRREDEYVRRQDEAALRAMRGEPYPHRKKPSK